MRKKFMLLLLVMLLVLSGFYFRNVFYALVCGSEQIDLHTLSILLNGRINSAKEVSLTNDKISYVIPLPKEAACVDENEYLIPKSNWDSYKIELIKTQWSNIEKIGTLVMVRSGDGKEFNISLSPFTGAYLRLKYSIANKR